jgi:hypothetical protein
LFSLGVALLVAYLSRRREDRAAAMLLVGSLVQMISRKVALEELAKKRAVPAADYHKWLSEKLVQSRPKLSTEFEASLIRLMPAHVYLAAHLELFKTVFAGMSENLDRIAEDYKNLHEKGKTLRPVAVMEADAKVATQSFEVAVLHARCAEHLIAEVVLSHFPSWHRLRQWLHPTDEERKCLELLRRGHA